MRSVLGQCPLLSSNLPGIEEELMKGAIVIIEDAEIRIRELPIR